MRRFASSTLAVVAVSAVAVSASTACLGRTGVSDDDLAALGAIDPTIDAGADTSTAIDSSVDTGVDTGVRPDTKSDAPPDRWIDIWEVLPIPDGGPIGDCLGCVRDKCGSSVNACINDPKCRSGLACTVTSCLTGGGGGGGGGGLGGFDFACVTKCFDGDLKAAGTAISTFTCLLGTCGSKCGGLLGGLGGGLPGGGGGGGGGGGLPGGAAFAARPSQGMTPEQFVSLPPGSSFYFYPEALSPWSEQLHATACAEKMISCGP